MPFVFRRRHSLYLQLDFYYLHIIASRFLINFRVRLFTAAFPLACSIYLGICPAVQLSPSCQHFVGPFGLCSAQLPLLHFGLLFSYFVFNRLFIVLFVVVAAAVGGLNVAAAFIISTFLTNSEFMS